MDNQESWGIIIGTACLCAILVIVPVIIIGCQICHEKPDVEPDPEDRV